MEIIFKDPPPQAVLAGRSGKYLEFAAALRDPTNEDPDQPGTSRWALLPTLDGSTRRVSQARTAAQNVRSGQMKDFPRGTFEAAWDAEGTVYVRYLGEDGREERPTPRPRKQAQAADDPSPQVPAAVREWARTNGFNVPDRGRLPENVIKAYRLAHPGYHYATMPVPADAAAVTA